MTEIASHRGGAALWPENSERAFRETMALGVEQIEFDVQLTADGVPVIFHDAMLDRVTDGSGPLAERTLGELKRLSIFNGGGRIMTLKEGARLLQPSGIVLRCEIKPGPGMRPYPGLVEKTLAELAALDLIPRTVITSFHLPTLSEVKRHRLPLRDLIWLVTTPVVRLTSPAHIARLTAGEGIGSISLHHEDLDEAALAALRDAGLAVGAFAVLEDTAIERAFRLGLAVFTTDRPDAALRIRRELTKEPAGQAG